MFGRMIVSSLLFLIHFYQRAFSIYRSPRCRFVPTCSVYMAEALTEQGAWQGLQTGLKRLLKCHPWGKSGFDPLVALSHQEDPQ
jgi:uncharacterized protein